MPPVAGWRKTERVDWPGLRLRRSEGVTEWRNERAPGPVRLWIYISHTSSFPLPRNNEPVLDHVRNVKQTGFLTDKFMTVTNSLIGIENRH